MRFGAHYLPTYVPELDGSVANFYQLMFEQVEQLEGLRRDCSQSPNLSVCHSPHHKEAPPGSCPQRASVSQPAGRGGILRNGGRYIEWASGDGSRKR